MSVRANLVIGADGSTSAGGTSKNLSSPEDRRRFHDLRVGADFIFIGGNTARNEPYESTPIPLVVASRFKAIEKISNNPLAEVSNETPIKALTTAIKKFGPNVIVEGGPNLLLEIIKQIEELYITISNRTGDGQVVSFDGLTRDFIMEDMEKIEGEIFYKFKRLK